MSIPVIKFSFLLNTLCTSVFFSFWGPPLLYSQNFYKICLLPAIFILSKQSLTCITILT